jgi:DNA topoisomerase-1
MKPAVYDTVTVDIETLISGQPTIYLFRATGATLRFAGFLKVYGIDEDAEEARGKAGERKDGKTGKNTNWKELGENRGGRMAGEQSSDEAGIENEAMPELSKGDLLTLHRLLPKQHFTQPPKRYTEAQLIGALKKLGLGRPSTYATIVETLKDRKYVGLEQKRLYPTPLGFQVCELLERHVTLAVDVDFTARMEADLDRVAAGEIDRLTMMQEFYEPFKIVVDQAMAAARSERQPAARQGEGSGKSRKRTRAGGSQRQAKSLPKSSKEGQPCPQCQEGTLVVKSGKFGPFLGCSRYALGCQYTENLGQTKQFRGGKSRKRTGKAKPH